MGYAKYVGRVGALAVALGIGTAVITTPGIAWADETGASSNDGPSQNTSGTGGSGDTGGQNTATGGDTTPTPDTGDHKKTPTGTGTTTASTTTTTQGSTTTTTVGGDSTPQVTFGSSTNTGSIGTTKDDVEPLAPSSTAATVQKIVESSSPSTVEVTTLASTPPPIPGIPTATPTAEQAPVSLAATTPNGPGTPKSAANALALAAISSAGANAGVPAGQDTVGSFAARFATPNALDNAATTNGVQDNTFNALVAPTLPVASVPPPSLVDTVLALPGTIISTALNLITQALAPLIGPGAPADNPVLWAVLAFVRRQFNQGSANSTPVLAPQQTSQDLDDAQVHGTFGGTDVDGDALTYTVPITGLGAPIHGDVTINQAAGTWTYTPDAGYVGQDYFFVTATDDTGGPHVHAIGQTHLAAARVDVHVESTAEADPPVVPDPEHAFTPDPPQPGDPTGTVRGTVHAIDPQGLPVTYGYTGPASTADGSTVVVNSDGSFVYTPSDGARHDAAAGADTATFAVTATNTRGASADILVSVAISPTLNQTPTAPAAPPPPTGIDHSNGKTTGVIGYTDPDNDTLTYTGPVGGLTAGGGIVVVNPNGSYTYTPDPADRHPAAAADAAQTGADTDSFEVGISDGHGFTRTVTVHIPIDPANQPPTPPATPPPPAGVDHTDGKTTGTIGYTDPDNDTLTYSNPGVGTSNAWTTAGGGQVTVTSTGGYTYTPDPADRLNAYTHPDQRTDTFDVTLADSHGITQIVTVPVQIDPAGAVVVGDAIVPAIQGAQNSYFTVNGENGTTAVIARTGSNDSPRTAIMVIHPDGSYTSTSADGRAPDEVDRALVGVDGTFAVTTYTGSGSASDPYRSIITVVHPDGSITSSEPVLGRPLSIASQNDRSIGVDGTVAETIFAGTGSETDPYRTTLTVVHPDGRVTSRTIDSYPIHYGSVGVDGTAAVTTLNGAFTSGPVSYTVTVIHPDGAITTSDPITYQIVGNGGAVVADDGTVYQTVRTSDGTALATIHPDGSITTNLVAAGTPSDIVKAGEDGTLAQTSHTVQFDVDPETGATVRSFQTTVTVIHPDGTTTIQTVDGQPSYSSLGVDGTFAQLVIAGDGSDENPYATALLVIHPDGTSSFTDYYQGQPVYPGTRSTVVSVGADGTAAIRVIRFTGDPDDPYRIVLAVVHPDGSITGDESHDLYQGIAHVGDDGTVAHVTQRYEAGRPVTTLRVIRPDGTKLAIPVGDNGGTDIVAVGADGTVYVTTRELDDFGGLSGRTVVTVLLSNGDTESVTLPGFPDGPVTLAESGIASQATYTGFPSRSYMVSFIAVAEMPAEITV